jgi:hypothetical protein
MPIQVSGVEKLSVSDLLDRYAANQDKLKSFIVKTKSVSTRLTPEASTPKEGELQTIKELWLDEFRYQGSGGEMAAFLNYKKFNLGDDGIWIPKDQDRSYTNLWDGKRYYDYYKGPSLESSSIDISSDVYKMKSTIGRMFTGRALVLGILYGDLDRFDSILRQSDSISVRSELERVGSVDCYVIDSKSKHGTHTVWLDPEHGYGIAKAVVHKGPEDVVDGRKLSIYKDGALYKGISFFMENVQFENIEGIWIPMEADTRIVRELHDGTRSWHFHDQIVHIDIDPNHAELQSFVLNVQNGTRTYIDDGLGINYTWQDGKLEDMTGQRYSLDDIFNLPKLEGKVLPSLDDFNPKPTKEQLQNKPILVCFWDMDLCPSSVNYVLGLKEKQAVLADKNVFVFLVHMGVVQQEILKAWLEGQEIPFMCGLIQGDANETLRRWCVRGLPWPILMDSKHIVRAEGLRLHELDDKIEEFGKKVDSKQ